MPYTPPSRSPASSNANSPVLSRNHSYEGQISSPQRPGLPRSRSAAYIQKHRRSPSTSDQQHSTTHTIHESTSAVDHGLHIAPRRLQQHNASDVPSPSKEVDQSTAEASTVSPTESSVTSDDDEDQRGRGRQIQDLANSLKNIVLVTRSSSPPGTGEESKPTLALVAPASSLPTMNGAPLSALTFTARKIAHSRSSSEIQLSKLMDVTSQAASSDSEDDDDLLVKPPMVRKKSGELVKPALRPSSRRRPSSMPGTPTFSKAVHFNEDIEQVRHFLQVDRPSAVSATSSPVETYDSESEYPFGVVKKPDVTEWEIRLANFPTESHWRNTAVVRVERIFLAADQKMLVGVVAVANIAFNKHIVARFTFDYWKTTSEVVAEFNHDVRKKEANDGYDRFNFNIKLADQAHLETKTLFICVRYNVAGQEHWDSNANMNYQVDFVKKVVPRKASQAAGAGTLGAIPRSRHTPATGQPRPRSFPASHDDDLAAQFEFGLAANSPRGTEPPSRRGRGRNGSLYPTQQKRSQPQQQGGAFGTRYDFGASLSAALTRAQSQMTPPPHPVLARSKSSDHVHQMTSVAPRTAAPAVQPVEAPKVSSDRPELGSQEYHDLIQKFCYFGSKAGLPGINSPDGAPKQDAGAAAATESTPLKQSETSENLQPEGAHLTESDTSDGSTPNSSNSSASNSPRAERLEPVQQLDGNNDSHRSSRSSTPSRHSNASPRLIAQYRSASPALGHELPCLLAR